MWEFFIAEDLRKMASEHTPNVLNLWSVEVAKRMFQVKEWKRNSKKKKKLSKPTRVYSRRVV